MTKYDAWVLARILQDLPVSGKLEAMTPRFQRLAELLTAFPKPNRTRLLGIFLRVDDRGTEFCTQVLRTEPNGLEPERIDDRGATLADISRLDVDRTWPWPGWLARGALTSLAADPGIGKTLLAMTISRNLWTGAPWPDGQPSTFPPETKTLWVPGDHHFGQLIEVANAYGLPAHSILLNGLANEPTGRLFLDDPDVVMALERRVIKEAPGMVVVDTVGMTTDRNLGRPDEARLYFEPLMRIAGKTGTPFLLLTHLSKDAQALGRRIVGASRVVWKLTMPDPDNHHDRRKLFVDKSYAMKPEPLGMTIAADGCAFDADPPSEPAKDKGGRPSDCQQWLTERLASPARLRDVRDDAERAGYGGGPLYRAKRMLGVEESVRDGVKWWALPDAA